MALLKVTICEYNKQLVSPSVSRWDHDPTEFPAEIALTKPAQERVVFELLLCDNGSVLGVHFAHQHDIEAGLMVADVNDGAFDLVQVLLSLRLDLETTKETTEKIVATSDRVIDEMCLAKNGEHNGDTHAINSHD